MHNVSHELETTWDKWITTNTAPIQLTDCPGTSKFLTNCTHVRGKILHTSNTVQPPRILHGIWPVNPKANIKFNDSLIINQNGLQDFNSTRTFCKLSYVLVGKWVLHNLLVMCLIYAQTHVTKMGYRNFILWSTVRNKSLLDKVITTPYNPHSHVER